MKRGKPKGTVYLLHFDRPYEHAKHYLGWTSDLESRLAEHRDGRGARLMTVVKNAGIGFSLARTWEGTRTRERQLKRMGGASRRCPLCGVHPRKEPAPEVEEAGRVIAQARRDITARRADPRDEQGRRIGDPGAQSSEDIERMCRDIEARRAAHGRRERTR